MDRFSRETRSRIMASIKSSDTVPELRLRSSLETAGLNGFAVNVKGIPGTPDIAFVEKGVLVFVDGCFWHGCPDHCSVPKSAVTKWTAHFKRNRERDDRQRACLREYGWRVLAFWEHDVVGKAARLQEVVEEIRKALEEKTTEPAGVPGKGLFLF